MERNDLLRKRAILRCAAGDHGADGAGGIGGPGATSDGGAGADGHAMWLRGAVTAMEGVTTVGVMACSSNSADTDGNDMADVASTSLL